jgi:effector-binding domain-containing protein
MLETPAITETTAHPAAVIRLTIPRAEIRNVMGPGIGELMSTIAAQGIAPAGAWFTHHFRIDPEVFDFEIGIPVASEVAPSGRVLSSLMPAKKVARTIYQGPYEGLGPAWREFDAWVANSGHTAADDRFERYLQGPESGSDAVTFRTELSRQLAD